MARTSQDRVKVNVYLPRNLLAALQRLGQLRGTTYSELVRQACHRFVVTETPPATEEAKTIGQAGEAHES